MRTTHLILEALDARILPSVSFASPHPFAMAAAVVAPPINPLHGTATGNYIGATLVVDAGSYDDLTGTANFGGRGSFGLSGWIQGVGMIAHGRAEGQLVLSNSQGTITLTLRGPLQSAFSPIPARMGFSITGGTGAYQHLTGHGKVTVSLHPAPTAFGLPPQGIFDMSFS